MGAAGFVNFIRTRYLKYPQGMHYNLSRNRQNHTGSRNRRIYLLEIPCDWVRIIGMSSEDICKGYIVTGRGPGGIVEMSGEDICKGYIVTGRGTGGIIDMSSEDICRGCVVAV